MVSPLAVVVLAAGKGTRTRLPVPKVLLPACGRTLIEWVLAAVDELAPERTVIVLHHGKDEVERSLDLHSRHNVTTVDQRELRGTGHAVLAVEQALSGFTGDVLVVYGDCPLITPATLKRLRAARHENAAAVLTAFPNDAFGLGRILRDPTGRL